jgi:hypothetical protein
MLLVRDSVRQSQVEPGRILQKVAVECTGTESFALIQPVRTDEHDEVHARRNSSATGKILGNPGK